MKLYDEGYAGQTLFDDWLANIGEILPPPISVKSSLYRRWLVSLINSIPESSRGVLSIGSGLGYTEVALQNSGLQIVASDSHPRAVSICRKQGLSTIEFDFFCGNIPKSIKFQVIYLDGVFGHLWLDETSGAKIWNRLSEIKPDAIVVASNDIADELTPSWEMTNLPDHKFFRPQSYWYSCDAKKHGWETQFIRKIPYSRRGKKRFREVLVLSTDVRMGNM